MTVQRLVSNISSWILDGRMLSRSWSWPTSRTRCWTSKSSSKHVCTSLPGHLQPLMLISSTKGMNGRPAWRSIMSPYLQIPISVSQLSQEMSLTTTSKHLLPAIHCEPVLIISYYSVVSVKSASAFLSMPGRERDKPFVDHVYSSPRQSWTMWFVKWGCILGVVFGIIKAYQIYSSGPMGRGSAFDMRKYNPNKRFWVNAIINSNGMVDICRQQRMALFTLCMVFMSICTKNIWSKLMGPEGPGCPEWIEKCYLTMLLLMLRGKYYCYNYWWMNVDGVNLLC